MKLVAIYLLLKVFAFIAATKPRTVNLNLETVLEFENKDNSADFQIIDNIQTFLEKVKNVIYRKRIARRSIDDREYTFTDFIENVIITLNSFADEDLEDTIAVLDDEIRKYHYRGCKFHELIENKDLRRFVALKLDRVRDEPAKSIKRNLETILNVLDEVNLDRNVKDIIDYVNSLYRQDSEDKFKSFLNNLQLYKSKSKRANLDLIKVVREGIRNIIFDHYTNLNVNARRDLKLKLELFWKNYLNHKKLDYRVLNIEYTTSSKNLDLNYINKYDKQERHHDNATISSPIESKSDFNLKHINVLNNFSSSKQYNELRNDNSLSNYKIREGIVPQVKKFSKEKVIGETNNFTPININSFPQIIKTKSEKSHQTNKTYNDLDNKSKSKKGKNTFSTNKYVVQKKKESHEYSTNRNIATPKNHELKKKHRFDIKNNADSNNKMPINQFNDLINASDDDPDNFSKPTKQVNLDNSKQKIINSYEDNNESIHAKEYSPYYSKRPNENKLNKIKGYSSSTIKDTFKAKNKIKHQKLVVTLYPEDITTNRKRKTTTTRNYNLQTLWLEEIKYKQHNAIDQKQKKTKKKDIRRKEYPFSEEILENGMKTSKFKRGHHQNPGNQQLMYKRKSSKSRQYSKKAAEMSRKFLRAQTTLSSDEGISIEGFESANKEKYFRKSNDFVNLVQNGTGTQESNATTIKSISEKKFSTASTEFGVEKLNEVADYGLLDFWEGTTKNIIIEATTKPTLIIKDFTTITKALEFISSVQLYTSTKSDVNDNVTAETDSTVTSTNSPGFILLSSNDIKPNIINLKNQVEKALNLTYPLTDLEKTTHVNVKTSPAYTTIKLDNKSTTAKTKTSSKSSANFKTVTKQKANMKISLTPSKQTSEDITKNITLQEKSSTISENADTINVIKFLNQSEALNTEDERKNKIMHDKFMKDMAAIFAPTTKSTVTYVIPKEATDPFKDIEDELGID